MTRLHRRNLLKLAGAVPAFGAAARAARTERVLVFMDPENAVTAGEPVTRALEVLRTALASKGASMEMAQIEPDIMTTASVGLDFLSSNLPGSPLHSPGRLKAGPEYLRIVPSKALPDVILDGKTLLGAGRGVANPTVLSVQETDARGYVYALLELAERVRFGGVAALHLTEEIEEAPANRVRSVARSLCSEIEDKAWFYDRDFWRGYLDNLIACRFNRFNLFLGIAYDFPRGVTDDYMHFPYPYLVTVPEYDVHAVPLAEGEREKNLAALQFIARETVARGLDFQLGLWTHAYEWTDSPDSWHHITGLTPATHAPYCRDALALLLKSVPEISGLTMRIHGESGIPEGSYPFWQTVFDAIPAAGRRIEIDMHAKGLDQTMIDMAVKTGMPVKAGCKYSAEHHSLGYHQADIRPVEIPRPGPVNDATFAHSEGDRRFTRYGYADLYQEGRKFDVLYRLWPGTQHHLLWGDPVQASAFGHSSHFCDAAGLELMEPLTFKGREGSGHPGGRCAYADKSLDPGVADWTKFAASYRLWGRLLYNPDATSDAWRREPVPLFGTKLRAAEEALANSSRILPLLTSAHLPSASNHSLDYEMAVNMPIVAGGDVPYTDTSEPKIYAHATGLDPQLFSTIADHAADTLAGRSGGKYSPVEVAAWVDGFADASDTSLAGVRKAAGANAAFRRLDEDCRLVNSMGRFYAAKLRAALLYEIWLATHDAKAGALALGFYRKGRAAWVAMAERAKNIYVADVSYGRIPMRRGHWADRLAGIDKDIEAMQTAIAAGGPRSGDAAAAIAKVNAPAPRQSVPVRHAVPETFRPGAPLPLSMSAGEEISARLHYRHVNQAERWRDMPMTKTGADFAAAIPGDYTGSPFPLQYYFELSRAGAAWLYPAFNATLSNQPYFAVWKRC